MAWRDRRDPVMLRLFVLFLLAVWGGGLLAGLFWTLRSPAAALTSGIGLVLLSLAVYVVARPLVHSASADLDSARRADSEKLLRAITAALPDRIVILDAEGYYLDVLKADNQDVRIGQKRGTVGGHVREFFPEGFVDFALQTVRTAIDSQVMQVVEYQTPFEDSDYHLEGRVVPFTDPLSGADRVIWITRNISTRKAAETALIESEKLLRSIISALPDRTIIFDAEGRYQEVLQPAFDSSHQLEALQHVAVGQRIHDHFPTEFADFCVQMIEKTLSSGTMQVFDYASPIHDTPRNLESRTIPFRNPRTGESMVLWVTRDITERSESERQRLELLIQEERLNFLHQFIDNVTHDLKTPLTVIETSLYLLQRAEATATPERIAIIQAQVDTLKQMIDDLLIISRLDSVPTLEANPTDLAQMLRDLTTQLRPQAEASGLRLESSLTSADLTLPIAVHEMNRAIMNLVHNAIKYTPDAGQVLLRLFEEPSHAVIEIVDTGIGISPDDLPHLFERFYRCENGRRVASGTGLGLAIVQRIVELHGGRVEVASTIGEGSTFRIILPRPEAQLTR